MENQQQIEQEISSHKRQLEQNVEELRSRVHDAADWKKQYERNTLLSLGLAFGGGLLISALITPDGRGRQYRASYRNGGADEPSGPNPLQDLWTGVTAAATSLAVTKIKEVVDEVLPGFGEHYDRVKSQHV